MSVILTFHRELAAERWIQVTVIAWRWSLDVHYIRQALLLYKVAAAKDNEEDIRVLSSQILFMRSSPTNPLYCFSESYASKEDGKFWIVAECPQYKAWSFRSHCDSASFNDKSHWWSQSSSVALLLINNIWAWIVILNYMI